MGSQARRQRCLFALERAARVGRRRFSLARPRARIDAWLALLFCAACGSDSVASSVQPVYGDPCKFAQCSGHGSCEPDPRGEPSCVCDQGYAGEHCGECALGFHLGVERSCLPDQSCFEQDVDPCGRHGACIDDTGGITCECDQGYEGARCDLCVAGYGHSEFGECLQLVLSRGDAQPLPAACSDETCRGHGQCTEIQEGLVCECFPGYRGARCDTCVDGYVLRGDRCVAELPCEASDCGLCEEFAALEQFPARPDNCFSSETLRLPDVTLRSLAGEGTVWLCGPSTYYGLTSEHVALEAGNELPAELVFRTPVTKLRFDYGVRSLGVSETVPLDFMADERVVASVDDKRGSSGAVELTFEEPIEVLKVRSMGAFTEEVAIDNLIYERVACD
jgi:hypothetical protein